jgi:lincosamide nucleotidyltransferase A/C/D/E
MSEVDVRQIVDLMERKDLDVWVDGGWGVDALLQETTRPHRDFCQMVEASTTRHRRQVSSVVDSFDALT